MAESHLPGMYFYLSSDLGRRCARRRDDGSGVGLQYHFVCICGRLEVGTALHESDGDAELEDLHITGETTTFA